MTERARGSHRTFIFLFLRLLRRRLVSVKRSARRHWRESISVGLCGSCLYRVVSERTPPRWRSHEVCVFVGLCRKSNGGRMPNASSEAVLFFLP